MNNSNDRNLGPSIRRGIVLNSGTSKNLDNFKPLYGEMAYVKDIQEIVMGRDNGQLAFLGSANIRREPTGNIKILKGVSNLFVTVDSKKQGKAFEDPGRELLLSMKGNTDSIVDLIRELSELPGGDEIMKRYKAVVMSKKENNNEQKGE